VYPLLNDGKYFLSVVLFVVENHCQVACLLDEVVSWADVSRERSQSPFDYSPGSSPFPFACRFESCGIVDVLGLGLLGVCFRPNLIPAARFTLPNVGSSRRKAYDSNG